MLTRKQLNNIMEVLKKAKISSENYDSTQEPFFCRDNGKRKF